MFVDYLRLYLGAITGVIIALLVVVFLARMGRRHLSAEIHPWISRGRNILIVLILFFFGTYLFNSLSVNIVPRDTIDRSSLDEQQKAHEQRYPAPQKGEGQ